MTITAPCAATLRDLVATVEAELTHERTKESLARLRRKIVRELHAVADMLDGNYAVSPAPEPEPKKKPTRRSRRTILSAKGENVIAVDFKSKARAEAEAVFRKP